MSEPDTSSDIAPIEVTIELASPPARAFEQFTSGYGAWWPIATHSLSRAPTTRCAIEPERGGRVFETAPDGTEHVWGRVIAWEPGQRLRFTWHPGREAGSAQWIELRFETRGEGSLVTLIHGGWERLGEIAPILRREYVGGWGYVFGDLFRLYAQKG